MSHAAEVELALPERYAFRASLAPWQANRADPTCRLDDRGMVKATRTEDGPVTFAVVREGDRVRARVWGPGAERVVATLPDLLGLGDRPEALVTDHPLIRDLQRRHRGIHLVRTRRVMEALLLRVLEQLVTGVESKHGWLALVRRLGEPAPGPYDLLLPPEPRALRDLPGWAWREAGVRSRAAQTLRHAADRARRLEEAAWMSPENAWNRLTAIPGIGPWTTALVLAQVIGWADAVPVADFHLPNLVSWALAGEERGDDARMLELLEPFRPHRWRVLQLLHAGGLSAPRKGPRKDVPDEFRR